MLKKTKIIGTVGPALDAEGKLEAVLEKGMNCARFNFSHGSHEDHLMRIEKLRQAAQNVDKLVALLLDTKGPEIRLGLFAGGKTVLEQGSQFVLVNDDILGTNEKATLTHKGLYQDVKVGTKILLSDGLIELLVKEINGKDIVTEVLNTGTISDRKRVAVPGIELSLPPISAEDRDDIIFGVENDMDFVAASFIQRASDVEEIRALINEHKGHMEIIAKIENQAGVDNLDEIIAAADGIMVARGDLGVEVPAEDVPLIQKNIIAKCNKAGKIVIVATQMLESMIENPRPTRAEVNDVANAIMDGADVIMLSGETASGKYPVEAVETMSRIAKKVESSLHYRTNLQELGFRFTDRLADAVAHSSVQLALELQAKAIMVATRNGFTVQRVSAYRPKASILTFTKCKHLRRHLVLRWGVYIMYGDIPEVVEDPTAYAIEAAMKKGYLAKGDIAIAAGSHQVGEKMSGILEVRTVDEGMDEHFKIALQ